MSKQIAIRAQITSSGEIKTFLGKDYLVAPVVAMVEGVRSGANQTAPELGLATDFGKFVQTWNNKPLTVNHPQIEEEYVSANSLSVLEQFAFGITMNARVEDKKLKMEAWVDVERANALEGAQDFVDRINAGEMIEVSVGFFAEVEQVTGTYDGKDYAGIWRNIVPDHLAFLSLGFLGACSNVDGCGVPRVNVQTQETFMTLSTSTTGNIDPTIKAQCGCQTKVQSDPKSSYGRVIAQAIAGDVLNTDVWTLLSRALQDKFEYGAYLYGFTPEKAVYETWRDNAWRCYQVSFDVSSDGVATLKDDEEEVVMVTKVMPKSKENGMTTQNENPDENKEPQEPEIVETPAEAPEAAPETPAEEAPEVEGTTEQPLTHAAAPISLEQSLKQMSADDRALVEESLRAHKAQKTDAINALKATGRCKLSDEKLNAMSLQDLRDLAELAEVPSYEGRSGPTAPKAQTSNDGGFVEAPKVFGIKSVA